MNKARCGLGIVAAHGLIGVALPRQIDRDETSSRVREGGGPACPHDPIQPMWRTPEED
jgi:hypothetical protein